MLQDRGKKRMRDEIAPQTEEGIRKVISELEVLLAKTLEEEKDIRPKKSYEIMEKLDQAKRSLSKKVSNKEEEKAFGKISPFLGEPPPLPSVLQVASLFHVPHSQKEGERILGHDAMLQSCVTEKKPFSVRS